jgi:hypothetical protein
MVEDGAFFKGKIDIRSAQPAQNTFTASEAPESGAHVMN